MNLEEIKSTMSLLPPSPWSWNSSQTAPYTVYWNPSISKTKQVPLFDVTPAAINIVESDLEVMHFLVKTPEMIQSLVKLLDEAYTEIDKLNSQIQSYGVRVSYSDGDYSAAHKYTGYWIEKSWRVLDA
jgi:hypothetical protein